MGRMMRNLVQVKEGATSADMKKFVSLSRYKGTQQTIS